MYICTKMFMGCEYLLVSDVQARLLRAQASKVRAWLRPGVAQARALSTCKSIVIIICPNITRDRYCCYVIVVVHWCPSWHHMVVPQHRPASTITISLSVSEADCKCACGSKFSSSPDRTKA